MNSQVRGEYLWSVLSVVQRWNRKAGRSSLSGCGKGPANWDAPDLILTAFCTYNFPQKPQKWDMGVPEGAGVILTEMGRICWQKEGWRSPVPSGVCRMRSVLALPYRAPSAWRLPLCCTTQLQVHVLELRSGLHLLSAGYTKQKEDSWMQGLMLFLCFPRGLTEQTILN